MLLKLKQYDIFISYVVEDREIVEDLCKKLKERKISVWYAKEQLIVGADVVTVIKEGLKNVRYGALIISPRYKGYWSEVETFVLMDNKDRLLPILHEKTFEEVKKEIPDIQNIWCLNTKEGIDKVVDEICKRVKPKSKIYYAIASATGYMKKNWNTTQYFILALILLLFIILGASYYYSIRPSRQFINNIIKQRQNTIETLVKKEFEDDLTENNCTISSLNEITKLTPASNSRFYFYNGIDHIQSLTGLKNEGIIPTVEPIVPPFGLLEYKIYLFNTKQTNPTGAKYALVNLIPQQYTITDTRLDDDLFEVDVHYTHPLRYIEVNTYTDAGNNISSAINLLGTKPNETFVFEKNGANWLLLVIQ